MAVTLTKRVDINLQAVLRVAWQGEHVRLSEDALREIARCREAFLRLIDNDPNVMIYGVTTAMGELASERLSVEERARHARIKAFAAATSFGDPYPDRVVRAMILARLANFIEGNAATTPRIALAVAAMLDGRTLPTVASSGQGGAGEILALYPLFAELTASFDLEVKERGSLINGSPCAAALLADAALAARRRLGLVIHDHSSRSMREDALGPSGMQRNRACRRGMRIGAMWRPALRLVPRAGPRATSN